MVHIFAVTFANGVLQNDPSVRSSAAPLGSSMSSSNIVLIDIEKASATSTVTWIVLLLFSAFSIAGRVIYFTQCSICNVTYLHVRFIIM